MSVVPLMVYDEFWVISRRMISLAMMLLLFDKGKARKTHGPQIV